MVSTLLVSRKWRSLVMVTLIPLLEEVMEHNWESGHGLCPSDLEKWKGVAMAIPISLPEGRRGGNHALCLSLLGKWWSS